MVTVDKAMRDTPLTDAEAVRFARIMVDFHAGAKVTELVPADFARNLERKLRDDQTIIGEVMDRALTAEEREKRLQQRIDVLLNALSDIEADNCGACDTASTAKRALELDEKLKVIA
ncbi:MAG: hypothetical protein IT514_15550 [Burkholderiales bacterium]|nr:hypothetical protein [Burkholderiales bacterium]